MKPAFGRCAFACCLVTNVFSQGTVWFANRQPEGGDSYQYVFADGTGVGTGYTAQLFGGPVGTSVDRLQPLFPTTTFNPRAPGYVIPVVVTVPGVLPGEEVTILARIFNGSTWEDSTCRAEDLFVRRPVGEPDVPVDTRGSGAVVTCIPEPGALALSLVGSAIFSLWRKARVT